MPKKLARDRIVRLLQYRGPWRTREIADKLDLSPSTVSTNLTRLAEEGRALRIRGGLWAAPGRGLVPMSLPRQHTQVVNAAPARQRTRVGSHLARRLLDLMSVPRSLPEMAAILDAYTYEAVRAQTQTLVSAGHVIRTPTARNSLKYTFHRQDLTDLQIGDIDISDAQARALSALSPGTYVDRADLCRTISLERGQLMRLSRHGLVRIVWTGLAFAVRLTPAGLQHPRRNPNGTKARKLLDSLADGQAALPLILTLERVTSNEIEKLRRAGYWASPHGSHAGEAMNQMHCTGLVQKSGRTRGQRIWTLTEDGRRLARIAATQQPAWTSAELREVIARMPRYEYRPSRTTKRAPAAAA